MIESSHKREKEREKQNSRFCPKQQISNGSFSIVHRWIGLKFKLHVPIILFFILVGGDVDWIGEIGFAREKLGFPFLYIAAILERQFLILSPLDRREI